jgi:hypothetical protein
VVRISVAGLLDSVVAPVQAAAMAKLEEAIPQLRNNWATETNPSPITTAVN